MKVLSLLQPWATLIVLGHKRIETRSWMPIHRGELLIHASQKKHKQYRELYYKWRDEYNLDLPLYERLPFGAIIGKVNLEETVTTNNLMGRVNKGLPRPTITLYSPRREWFCNEMEEAFGDYSPNRYGWLLSDPVAFETIIPAKGKLSIWEFNPDEAEKLIIHP